MRSLEERETALNMYFYEGRSYNYISKSLDIPIDTIKSWCRRYRERMGIPTRDRVSLRKEVVRKEDIQQRKSKNTSTEDRIAHLEMEVDLLRNFLILTERG